MPSALIRKQKKEPRFWKWRSIGLNETRNLLKMVINWPRNGLIRCGSGLSSRRWAWSKAREMILLPDNQRQIRVKISSKSTLALRYLEKTHTLDWPVK